MYWKRLTRTLVRLCHICLYTHAPVLGIRSAGCGALMRMYPWLTVQPLPRKLLLREVHSLLAQMPHTRKHKGKVLPLQTPQAFTNRTYRFRGPNQIPASNMKNGSATYKAQIQGIWLSKAHLRQRGCQFSTRIRLRKSER